MLPLGDDNSLRRTFPFVNYALIALNVLFFLGELGQADIVAYIERWGVIPVQIHAGQHLETLLTSMFLHAGWLHLLGNMLFLWIFGDNVEDAFGHVRYLLFYLACGIAAGLAQTFLNPHSLLPSIGASGAISGVLAAYVIMFRSNRVRVLIGFFFLVTVPAIAMIGIWILIQLFDEVASFAPSAQSVGGVAYGAHLGGFAAGLALTELLPKRLPQARAVYR